jgi:alkaline phosphatase D
MKILLSLFTVVSLSGFSQDTITTIAFGSCGHQNKPLTIFQTIAAHHPDLFIFLGDNIYADTKDMNLMRKKYKKLGNNPNYQFLKETTPIIATWDDHDYGMNDIGRHYEKKGASKKIFLKFFNEPSNSERYEHEGIYTSYEYVVNGKKLQLILLDLRTFRDDLMPYNGSLKADSNYRYQLDYSPQTSADSTILGADQWIWLKNQLSKPADLRIIGSSTQFATQYNGYETWANFPNEQEKMFQLIKDTKANGVVFISGDVHYSELSKMETNTSPYPIYDLTSSGLTEEWKFATPNQYRIGNPVMNNHFGLISIDWDARFPIVKMEIIDDSNQVRILQTIQLEELQVND